MGDSMSVTKRTAALAVVLLSLAMPAPAVTFNFLFDNNGLSGSGGNPLPPFIGTGTLSFNGDPDAGDYDITTLVNLDISFAVGDATFSEDDIDTTTEAYLRIAGTGDARTALFYTPLSVGNGCGFGAVDFAGSSLCLSTGPSDNIGKFVRIDDGALTYSGEYLGTVVAAPTSDVPLPAGLPLLLAGLGGLVALRRRG